MSKFPIFESLVKIAHITSATKLLLMIKEYDTISKFFVCSQKLNPSYDKWGSIYTKYGLLMSLKLLTNYILHGKIIEDKYHQKSTTLEDSELVFLFISAVVL